MTGTHAAASPEQAATVAGEYACARAWAALTAAHTRIAGQLSNALAQACDLSINDFEILVARANSKHTEVPIASADVAALIACE